VSYPSLLLAIGLGALVPYALWRFFPNLRSGWLYHSMLSAVLVPVMTLLGLIGLRAIGLITGELASLWSMTIQSSAHAIAVIIGTIVALNRKGGVS